MMKRFLMILVLGLFLSGLGLLLSGCSSDPWVYGCVYQEHDNSKIKCVSIKYNERKDPGSYDRAERACYRELNHYGKKYGEHGYWIDGCQSSGGAYPD